MFSLIHKARIWISLALVAGCWQRSTTIGQHQAIAEIAAAQEELRLARIRLDTGLGINIDVLNAQRDLTQANLNKAQAIAEFNMSQAQLLHDIGLISPLNLTSGRLITNINLPRAK